MIDADKTFKDQIQAQRMEIENSRCRIESCDGCIFIHSV